MDTIRDVNGPGIKLTGFTYSKIFNENNNETMKLTLGTRFFMAPEMVRNPGHIEHDMKVDTWAVGVVAFFILSAGQYPFQGRTKEQVDNAILNDEPALNILR